MLLNELCEVVAGLSSGLFHVGCLNHANLVGTTTVKDLVGEVSVFRKAGTTTNTSASKVKEEPKVWPPRTADIIVRPIVDPGQDVSKERVLGSDGVVCITCLSSLIWPLSVVSLLFDWSSTDSDVLIPVSVVNGSIEGTPGIAPVLLFLSRIPEQGDRCLLLKGINDAVFRVVWLIRAVRERSPLFGRRFLSFRSGGVWTQGFRSVIPDIPVRAPLGRSKGVTISLTVFLGNLSSSRLQIGLDVTRLRPPLEKIGVRPSQTQLDSLELRCIVLIGVSSVFNLAEDSKVGITGSIATSLRAFVGGWDLPGIGRDGEVDR